jgi:hypothetical protein
MIEVFSSGGGTQSACITALIVQAKLPKPDLAVIVDTERERPGVWEYHDRVIVPALASVGIAIHRISCRDFGYNGDRLFNGKGTLLIPAFSNLGPDGTGKLSNYCTTHWKIDSVKNWLRRKHGIRHGQARKWIGFSLDEASRYTRMALGKEAMRGLIRWPLIHDVPLRRRQAIKVVEDFGWPTPPRSACWMCPNQSDHEWRDLKENYPEEFAKAVELEREVRQRDPNAFLHYSCVPIDQVDFTEDDDLFSGRRCASAECFT